MANLSSLVVDLQLESAKMRTGLDEMNKRMVAFGKQAEGVGKQLKLAFGLNLAKDAVAGLSSFIMAGSEAVADMGDMAQAAGTTTEKFSELAYAAQLTGTSSEEMSGALGKLSQTMADAAAGGKDAEVFKALGVNIKDANGHLRTSSDVFADVAQAMSKLEDGASKVAIAQKIFGKSGADLIPLLNQGKEGLAAAADEAARFGLVISDEAAQAAEDFNKSIKRMELVGKGVAMAVAADIAPQFSALAKQWAESAKQSGIFEGAVKTLSVVMKVLGSGVIILKTALTSLGQQYAAVAAGAVEVWKGNFSGAVGVLEQLGKESVTLFKDAGKDFETLWGDAAKAAEESGKSQEKAIKESADGIVASYSKIEKAAKSAWDRMEDLSKKRARQRAKDAVEERKRQAAESVSGVDTDVGTAGGFVSLIPSLFKATSEAAEALKKDLADTFASLTSKFAGRTGGIGGLIESAQMGGKVGGPWGAIGAVALDLLSQSTQFQTIVGQMDTFIQQLADTLGKAFGPALEAISPLLGWVAGLLQTLAPVFELVGKAIGGIIDVVTFVIEGIANVWNAIVDTLDRVLGFFGIDLPNLRWEMQKLTDATENQTDVTKEVTKANDSLTNVPAGYKIALERFNAMDAVGGGGGAAAAPAGPVNYDIDIDARGMDPGELVGALEEHVRRATGRRAMLGGPRFSTVRDY